MTDTILQLSNTPTLRRPICWTIAGSDSGGGAGIQADLKTMNALGVHGCSVITALTAQNTLGVGAVDHVSPGMIEAQILALQKDLPPAAIKTGMLGNAVSVKIVAEFLRLNDAFVVCDPVMTATRGGALLEPDAAAMLRTDLFPHINLLTPNLPETENLVARAVRLETDVVRAAAQILDTGVKSVLIKGGHAGADLCQDYWTNGRESAWLSSRRQDVEHTHGGGCVLSSAIAAGVALGLSELDAIVLAKAYVNHGLRHGGGIGKGRAPLAHTGWPDDPADMPWITRTAAEAAQKLVFPDCGPEPLGLYPIVDRASWVERLLPLGVQTIQLRVKDLAGAELEAEVTRAIAAAASFKARLFVNDYWQLALKHGAYGVHLGQDDLPTADLGAIQKAGCRLGLSTHGYAEIARSMAVTPSYIAIGTVYPSPSKTFAHATLGLEAFARLRRLVGVPVVAIGGITIERARDVINAGADGLAVISDVTKAADMDGRVRDWLELLREMAIRR
ncbi:MAG: bifunctional hydroxymethylpyrimidine kinase/phosphomethylpyrimidine kinase [bacterium]